MATRKEFWEYVRKLEHYSGFPVRFSQHEVLSEGSGFQIQAKSWRHGTTGELLAQYRTRVEDAQAVSSEYEIFSGNL